MSQVTKEEVDFLKESGNLIKTILPYLQSYSSYEVIIKFDEKNGLPLIIIKKN